MAYNSKYTGEQVEELLGIIPGLENAINTHNKEVKFFCVETVVVKVGGVEHTCEANQIATVFVGDEEFEIIPTSNQSIKSLLGYPIPLTWYDWLEGVDVFENIVFDMNEFDTYKHWIQYYQDEYHVQKAQYSNCIFWSDKPYTHSPFEERTNYTLYYTAELPLCYSRIPENTYKPFYLAYGVKTDPNWNNPYYIDSYSNVSGATQTFSYYGMSAIGIFDMAVHPIKLPKDCRGLMFHAPAIQHAGVFDAIKTTNFGAKKGSWQEAFGDCISLTSLYIQNLKTSINISWSPINADSIEFIVNNAANTSAITISVSPYTWHRLSDEVKTAASAKNITIALLVGNFQDDSRWETKQDKEEGKGLSTEDFTTELKNKLSELGNSNILTCKFMGEVGEVIFSEDDQSNIEFIADWMDSLSSGKVCVLDFDGDDGYTMTYVLNYRSHAVYGSGMAHFSYVFDGYLYEVKYDAVALPVTLTIVNKVKIESGGNSDIDTSSFATKEEVMTSDIRVFADGFKSSNGEWFSLPHTDSEYNADYCLVTLDMIPEEVKLVTIEGDILADEPTYTTSEVQAIIDAYNANKLIAIKSSRTRSRYCGGWFIPNIKIGSQEDIYYTIELSGIVGYYYIEHRIIYDSSAGSISVTVNNMINLQEGSVTTTYVDQAIANAITNTLNTPV